MVLTQPFMYLLRALESRIRRKISEERLVREDLEAFSRWLPYVAVASYRKFLDLHAQGQGLRWDEFVSVYPSMVAADRVSAYGDHMFLTGHFAAGREILGRFVDFFRFPLADIGCGEGSMGGLFLHLALVEKWIDDPRAFYETKERTLVFVDRDPYMLEAAKRYTYLDRTPLLSRATATQFVCGDVYALQERCREIGGPFATILCSYLFHWLPDVPRAVAVLARCLEIGGHLVVLGEYPLVDSPSPVRRLLFHGQQVPRGISPRILTRACADAGLQRVAYTKAIVRHPHWWWRHPMFGAVFRKEG